MKKYLLGLFVLLTVITAAAFTTEKKPKTVYDYYFFYEGNTVGGQSNPENYTWLEEGPAELCEEEGILHCVINADMGDNERPILFSGETPVYTEVSSKPIAP